MTEVYTKSPLVFVHLSILFASTELLWVLEKTLFEGPCFFYVMISYPPLTMITDNGTDIFCPSISGHSGSATTFIAINVLLVDPPIARKFIS